MCIRDRWIGLYPGMDEAKLAYMVKTIRDFCAFAGNVRCHGKPIRRGI